MKHHVSFDIEFKKNKLPGKLIAIEGIDGSGKTTQAQLVVDLLKKQGYKAIYTKEPTDEPIGKFIREQILSGKVKVPPISIQYMFSADRAVHQVELEEYLKKGYIIITDRYFWSAIAYGISDLKGKADYYLSALSILSFYHRFLTPDYTFFLNIRAKEAAKRIGTSEKHKEIYDDATKLVKIKKAYDLLIKRFSKEFVLISAEQSIENVSEDILKKIKKLTKK
ncbi:dTMP kinase [Patescibacteria group bacterium]|nr:dTMP kinase [Patescibacteria group bacterium]